MIRVVCGVPGSGKSWVCEQLWDKYYYIPHDEYQDIPTYTTRILDSANGLKPVLADCPFAERLLKEELEKAGEKPEFFFIVEEPTVVIERYRERGKPIPPSHLTRLRSIPERAREWGAFCGTSEQVLERLKNI